LVKHNSNTSTIGSSHTIVMKIITIQILNNRINNLKKIMDG
jgi:hypothetical protein